MKQEYEKYNFQKRNMVYRNRSCFRKNHQQRACFNPLSLISTQARLYSLFREKDANIKEESGQNISSSFLSSVSNTLNIDVTEMTVGENYRITLYLAFIP